MDIRKSDFFSEAERAGIAPEKANDLWSALSGLGSGSEARSRFDLSNVLYYFGSAIVLAALGWFLAEGWERFGTKGLLSIAFIYMVLFALLGNKLWKNESTKVPGGLFIVLAVCMVPLVVYALELMSGIFLNIKDAEVRWIPMEVATIVAGGLALIWYRFPFLTMPVFFALWMMTFSLASLVSGWPAISDNQQLWISLYFGLFILLVAYVIDLKADVDYAFWGYLFGLCAFWISLTLLEYFSDKVSLSYLLINVGLIFLSVLLDRYVFIIFGTFGIFIYLNFIFYDYFRDSLLFPFMLSLIGIAVVFLGILYHRNHKKLQEGLFYYLPKSIHGFLPRSHPEE